LKRSGIPHGNANHLIADTFKNKGVYIMLLKIDLEIFTIHNQQGNEEADEVFS
jgi:hypothetical protein